MPAILEILGRGDAPSSSGSEGSVFYLEAQPQFFEDTQPDNTEGIGVSQWLLLATLLGIHHGLAGFLGLSHSRFATGRAVVKFLLADFGHGDTSSYSLALL